MKVEAAFLCLKTFLKINRKILGCEIEKDLPLGINNAKA